MNEADFKKRLAEKTMCSVQHNGWTCGTCFFGLSNTLKEEDWQNILLYRGDYQEMELDNLPVDREKSLNKIWGLITDYK